jgi:hypothetical protein
LRCSNSSIVQTVPNVQRGLILRVNFDVSLRSFDK